MQELIFLSNELQSPLAQKKLHLNLMPISPAMVFGKMYLNNRKPFIVEKNGKHSGSRVVYGTLYSVNDFEHYSRVLDALHDCSLALIGRNHILDLQHRIKSDIILISFDNIEQFKNAKAVELGTVNVYIYVGNKLHPTINKKLTSTKHSYRVKDNVAKEFYKQWEE